MWDLSSQNRAGTCVPCTARQILYHWTNHQGSPQSPAFILTCPFSPTMKQPSSPSELLKLKLKHVYLGCWEQGTSGTDSYNDESWRGAATLLWSLSKLLMARKALVPASCPPACCFKGEESWPPPWCWPGGEGRSARTVFPLVSLPFLWMQGRRKLVSSFKWILGLRAQNTWSISGSSFKLNHCCYSRDVSFVLSHSFRLFLYPQPR